MQRPTHSWSRYSAATRRQQQLQQQQWQQQQQQLQQQSYDEDDDLGGGATPNTTWVVAEACKVKDALFLGNVMAVQDGNFVVMNKIAFCVKCQTGFSVPQTLKRVGVNYMVMNLMGAFTDQNLTVETKDGLLEDFFSLMESAGEQGVGVLLYAFQDLAWCCFCVIAYWLRKYRWTVEHAVKVMKSRRPALVLESAALQELEALAERLAVRFKDEVHLEEERILTNTCSNAQRLNDGMVGDVSSPNTRARPLTAGENRSRIQWGKGNNLMAYGKLERSSSGSDLSGPIRTVRPILRKPRSQNGGAANEDRNRFLTPKFENKFEEMTKAPPPVHGAWAAMAGGKSQEKKQLMPMDSMKLSKGALAEIRNQKPMEESISEDSNTQPERKVTPDPGDAQSSVETVMHNRPPAAALSDRNSAERWAGEARAQETADGKSDETESDATTVVHGDQPDRTDGKDSGSKDSDEETDETSMDNFVNFVKKGGRSALMEQSVQNVKTEAHAASSAAHAGKDGTTGRTDSHPVHSGQSSAREETDQTSSRNPPSTTSSDSARSDRDDSAAISQPQPVERPSSRDIASQEAARRRSNSAIVEQKGRPASALEASQRANSDSKINVDSEAVHDVRDSRSQIQRRVFGRNLPPSGPADRRRSGRVDDDAQENNSAWAQQNRLRSFRRNPLSNSTNANKQSGGMGSEVVAENEHSTFISFVARPGSRGGQGEVGGDEMASNAAAARPRLGSASGDRNKPPMRLSTPQATTEQNGGMRASYSGDKWGVSSQGARRRDGLLVGGGGAGAENSRQDQMVQSEQNSSYKARHSLQRRFSAQPMGTRPSSALHSDNAPNNKLAMQSGRISPSSALAQTFPAQGAVNGGWMSGSQKMNLSMNSVHSLRPSSAGARALLGRGAGPWYNGRASSSNYGSRDGWK